MTAAEWEKRILSVVYSGRRDLPKEVQRLAAEIAELEARAQKPKPSAPAPAPVQPAPRQTKEPARKEDARKEDAESGKASLPRTAGTTANEP